MSEFKSAAGVEFCELIEEARKLGHRPADIARRMKLSKPTIHNYIVGKIEPPASRLDALRRILAELRPPVKYPTAEESVSGMRDQDVTEAADALQEIHEASPTTFETVNNMIRLAHGAVTRPSQQGDAAGRDMLRKAVEHIAPGALEAGSAGPGAPNPSAAAKTSGAHRVTYGAKRPRTPQRKKNLS